MTKPQVRGEEHDRIVSSSIGHRQPRRVRIIRPSVVRG